jgi:hypothetical protein
MGRNRIMDDLKSLSGIEVHHGSLTDAEGAGLALTEEDHPRIAVLASKGSPLLESFQGESSSRGESTLLLCPADARNLKALRGVLPWLKPRTLGLTTSAGLGDRLGLATPGHVRAVRAANGVAPIFAQQSIREMERTGRSPQEVVDDATLGVFAEGWKEAHGVDADHLKIGADVDACVVAGYTFYTFDPGEHVDDRAEGADGSTLRTLLEDLPWDRLEDSPSDLTRRYAGRAFDLDGREMVPEEAEVARAAVKYGRAVAHAAALYRHLEGKMGERPFEVEVSVDETETPTTHVQHLYIAGELSRLGVRWVSLAPRYVGSFEKGVDYIGSVEEFERDFAAHAAIARRFGPYKLSLHSGSDKFSVYPAAMRQTDGLVHLKTAGTSYLEALRAISTLDPSFFRELYAFARGRYEEDRASYHVSAELKKAVLPEEVADGELPDLLERFDEREILHVTFGSVLKSEALRDRLMALLRSHPEEYAACLEAHFLKHLEPFTTRT